MTVIWVSTEDFTCGIAVDEGRIVDAPPILKKFMGQPPINLRNWLERKGMTYEWQVI